MQLPPGTYWPVHPWVGGGYLHLQHGWLTATEEQAASLHVAPHDAGWPVVGRQRHLPQQAKALAPCQYQLPLEQPGPQHALQQFSIHISYFSHDACADI